MTKTAENKIKHKMYREIERVIGQIRDLMFTHRYKRDGKPYLLIYEEYGPPWFRIHITASGLFKLENLLKGTVKTRLTFTKLVEVVKGDLL